MRIRLFPLLLVISLLLSCLFDVRAQDAAVAPAPQKDTIKGSPARTEKGRIGKAEITIQYYSPAVRGRIIWGGLVPFDQVWVTGAHNATRMEFSRSVKINGQRLPAGKYAFFTIPGKSGWTCIINRNWEQHLTDEYNAADDVLRFDINPAAIHGYFERLSYQLVPNETNHKQGTLLVTWEKLQLAIPLEDD